MKAISISIITVSYNAALTIESSILSVIGQNYPFIEYIIVDGGSTDGTVDIIKKYNDKISYWINEPDNGIYDAMNKGIALATGDFIYFLGTDDLLIHNVVERVVPYLDDNNIVYGSVYMIHRQKIYDGQFNSLMLITRNIPHQATFYPKKVFTYYKFELKYIYLADYYMNLLCWKNKEFRFCYIPVVVAIYNDNSCSANIEDSNFVRDRNLILLRNLPFYCSPYILLRIIFRKIRSFIS